MSKSKKEEIRAARQCTVRTEDSLLSILEDIPSFLEGIKEKKESK